MLNLHDNHQTYMDEKKPYTLLMGNNYYYMITDKISLTCANSNITYLAENYDMDKISITLTIIYLIIPIKMVIYIKK